MSLCEVNHKATTWRRSGFRVSASARVASVSSECDGFSTVVSGFFFLIQDCVSAKEMWTNRRVREMRRKD